MTRLTERSSLLRCHHSRSASRSRLEWSSSLQHESAARTYSDMSRQVWSAD